MATRGFTLIELMIVLAIIGALASVGIPAYQDYVARTRIVEGLTLASAAKTAVSDYYFSKGVLADANTTVGLALPTSITGKAVKSVMVGGSLGAAGVITISMADAGIPKALQGKRLRLEPTASSTGIQWKCATTGSSLSVPDKYLPADCR